MKNNGVELLIILPRNNCTIKKNKYLSYVIKDNKCYVYLVYSNKYYLTTSLPSNLILNGREATKILHHMLNKSDEELYNAILSSGDTASKKTYRLNLTVSPIVAPKLFKLAFMFNVKISTIIRMLILSYYRSTTIKLAP